MTYTLPGLILLIVIAAVCGAIGKAIAGGVRGGLIVSRLSGSLRPASAPGSRRNWLPEPFMRPHLDSYRRVSSIVGAALFVAIIHLFYRR